MVYIHVKKEKNKRYYSIRKSIRKNNKISTKILYNFGEYISKKSLEKLPRKINIKNTKKIKEILEQKNCFKKAENKKIKKNKFFNKEQLIEIEAILIHFKKNYKKQNISEKIWKNLIFEDLEFEGKEKIKDAIKDLQIITKNPDLIKSPNIKENLLLHLSFLPNIQKILSFLENQKPKLDIKLIAKIHDMFVENIFREKGFRTQNLKVSNAFKTSKGKDVKKDLQKLINWFEKNKKKIHPLALATLFHHKFEKIHPFLYGNGEVGRILMNYILLNFNYPPIIIKRKFKKDYLKTMNLAYNSTKNDLLEMNLEHYKPLIEFMHKQFCKTYWEVFV